MGAAVLVAKQQPGPLPDIRPRTLPVPKTSSGTEDPRLTVAALSLYVALGTQAVSCLDELDWERV